MSAGQPEVRYLEGEDGRPLAYRLRPGAAPALVFLPGYASDMDGAKATALDEFAGRRGIATLRFDYSGTGSSSGHFEDGTLDRWLEEGQAMNDRLIEGSIIVIGSSMGGWIALHVALRLRERVQALVGIAAAPDFTDWGFTRDHKAVLGANGRIERPDPYGGEPQLTTMAFWRSGQALRLLDRSPSTVRCGWSTVMPIKTFRSRSPSSLCTSCVQPMSSSTS